MSSKSLMPAVLLLWQLSGVLQAAPPAPTHQITVDDLFTLGFLTECATSPDGTQVAFVQCVGFNRPTTVSPTCGC